MIFFQLFSLFIICINAYSNKIKMSDISTLTFFDGESTTSLRTSPIPQLECVGGSARSEYSLLPKAVQCTNVGFDGANVQWDCKADLDSKVKFGKMVVSCEGYDHKGDPFVLIGSCGLKYSLDYTHSGGQQHYSHSSYSSHQYESRVPSFFNLVVFGIMIYVMYRVFSSFGYRNGLYYPQQYGGGANNPQYGGVFPQPGYGGGWGSGGGGGFWSGLATGGLMSHLWNRNYNNGYYQQQRPTWGGNTYGGGYGSGNSRSRNASGFATSDTR